MRSSSPPAWNAVSARQSHGGEARIRFARFPARKTLEDFDFDHQRSVPPTSSPTSAPSTSSKPAPTPCSSARRAPARATSPSPSASEPVWPDTVAFATAAQWVDRLGAAHDAGRLQPELIRLGRVPLVVIDEVGYIPFQGEAANLFFQLVASPLRAGQRDRLLQQSVQSLG